MQRTPLSQAHKLRDDRAPALSALGYVLNPCAYHRQRDGSMRISWFVDAHPARPSPIAANDLLSRYELPGGPKALTVAEPEHPFLAAMYALEALRALEGWCRGTQPYLVLPGPGRLRRLVPPAECPPGLLNVSGEGWETRQGALVPFTPELTANNLDALQLASVCAAVVCGFPVWPAMSESGGRPALLFRHQSMTFEGLTLQTLSAAADPHALALPQFPGFTVGEHPVHYAIQAVLNERSIRKAEAQAALDPVIEFRSKNGKGGAVVTASLLREGRKDTASFRDQMARHLKKP